MKVFTPKHRGPHPIVSFVNYLTGRVPIESTEPVRPAILISYQSQLWKELMTMSDTQSAPNVPEPMFDLILTSDDPDSVSVKCGSPCNRLTVHLVWKIIPEGVEEQLDPMVQLKLAKRLQFCTNCATMRLTN